MEPLDVFEDESFGRDDARTIQLMALPELLERNILKYNI